MEIIGTLGQKIIDSYQAAGKYQKATALRRRVRKQLDAQERKTCEALALVRFFTTLAWLCDRDYRNYHNPESYLGVTLKQDVEERLRVWAIIDFVAHLKGLLVEDAKAEAERRAQAVVGLFEDLKYLLGYDARLVRERDRAITHALMLERQAAVAKRAKSKTSHLLKQAEAERAIFANCVRRLTLRTTKPE